MLKAREGYTVNAPTALGQLPWDTRDVPGPAQWSEWQENDRLEYLASVTPW